MKRFVSIIWLFILVASATAAMGDAVDPRTLTFPPIQFSLPVTERLVLENGMVVYLYEDHELPLVSITSYVRTGSIYEPAAKAGLAGITGAVMRSGGTRSTPAEKLDQELEFMASSIDSIIGSDVGNVSMSTLKKNLPRTLELFAQVMMEPAFREDRVNIAKNRTVESLRRQNDDPKSLADRELIKAIYQGHPMGVFPTIESVSAIGREDMVRFHERYYRPNNIMLAVAGDITRQELVTLLHKTFGGWQKGQVLLPKVPEPQPLKPEVLVVNRDLSQSVIRMGHLGITKDNPDLYAIRVMDYILGGGFTSRLMTQIRTNQGLAYNVDSNFDVGRLFAGTFQAETETKTGSTARAISLMQDIIAGMTKAPVTDQELKLAKDYIINSFIFGFAKPDAVVNQRVRLEYYGYPERYLENYRENIAKVTKEDVLRVAKKYLHPDRMVLVVVGKSTQFDKPLSQFGKVRELKLQNAR